MYSVDHRFTRTYVVVLGIIPGTSHDTWYCCMFEREHCAARCSATLQGRARHRTASHGSALRC